MISARLKNTESYGVVKIYSYDLGPYTVRVGEVGDHKEVMTIDQTDREDVFLPTIFLPGDTVNGDYGISLRPYQPMTPERTEKVIKGYQIALEAVDYLKTHKLN